MTKTNEELERKLLELIGTIGGYVNCQRYPQDYKPFSLEELLAVSDDTLKWLYPIPGRAAKP